MQWCGGLSNWRFVVGQEKEIKTDPRKTSDLFIDRYGAEPIHPAFLIKDDKFQEEVLESEKLVMAELFEDDSVRCLLKSISIKDLLADDPIKYRKVKVEKELVKKYKIKKMPTLLFFEKGKLLGKIEGYYENKQKAKLCKKIEAIMEKKKI